MRLLLAVAVVLSMALPQIASPAVDRGQLDNGKGPIVSGPKK